MANKQMKRCSTLLIISEIHFKTTMMYYFISVKMASNKKTKHNKY